MALSTRAEEGLNNSDFMIHAGGEYMANPYDAETNPEGIVNLGMAENTLCEDILMEKINKPDMLHVNTWQQYYFNWYGELSFRRVVAEFLTKYFKPAALINPEDLMVTAGVGAALEHMAYACADPGDCLLIPAPLYAVMIKDLSLRMNVKWFPIPLTMEPETKGEGPFQISQTLLEETYEKALAQGERVKGVLLANPNNPTGSIFNRESLQNLIDFTTRHDLHLIVDEIYALTIHGDNAEFPSIVSFPETVHNERVHMLWGISKDFGLSGMRLGVIYSGNQRMLQSLGHAAYLGSTSSLVLGVVTKLLSDHDWLDTVYFPTNRSRIRETYRYVEHELTKRGIIPFPAEATFFIWADFRKYVSTREEEQAFYAALFKAGVYMVPGYAMHARAPGWMRVTVTTDRALLNLGLERMDRVLGITP